jgi:molybdenum cofactor cytidylyltransferase
MIWAIILAAGESKRMGRQKLLLPFGRNTVIETIVRTALDSSADGTLVVLGADQDEVRQALKLYPVKLTVNEDFALGMLSSIQAGFQSLTGRIRAAIIMLGDQPAIPAEVLDDLIAAYQSKGRGIVIPVHGGRRGHPVLIDMKYKAEVMGLDPEVGLRQLVLAHSQDVLEVEAQTPAVLTDMDVPADYAVELERKKSRRAAGRTAGTRRSRTVRPSRPRH